MEKLGLEHETSAWPARLPSPGLWIHRENKAYETDTAHSGICAIMGSGRAIMVIKRLCRSSDTCLAVVCVAICLVSSVRVFDSMNCTFSINKVIFCLNQSVVVSIVYNQATSMIRKELKFLITGWSGEWIDAQIIKSTNKWIKQKVKWRLGSISMISAILSFFFLWPGLPQSFP